jgi:hypothetical protein
MMTPAQDSDRTVRRAAAPVPRQYRSAAVLALPLLADQAFDRGK